MALTGALYVIGCAIIDPEAATLSIFTRPNATIFAPNRYMINAIQGSSRNACNKQTNATNNELKGLRNSAI